MTRALTDAGFNEACTRTTSVAWISASETWKMALHRFVMYMPVQAISKQTAERGMPAIYTPVSNPAGCGDAVAAPVRRMRDASGGCSLRTADTTAACACRANGSFSSALASKRNAGPMIAPGRRTRLITITSTAMTQ